MIKIFAYCGIFSAIIMSFADMLLDLKGKDNTDLGKLELIKSSWDHMDEKRFSYSILIAMVGAPLQMLGCTAMAYQMSLQDKNFALAFWMICLIGATGSFFIHTLICLFPLIYKYMKPHYTFEMIDDFINHLFTLLKIPFSIQYLCLVGLSGVMIIYAIITNVISLPISFIILTPPVLTLLGLTLRKIKHDWFYDLPGIIMPSVGVGCIGLLALFTM